MKVAEAAERRTPPSSRLRRVVANAFSVLASDVLNRATSFVMYALIARYLGAFAFGQMSLALTLFYMFQVLAVAGVKTVIVREVAKDRERTEQYLVNGSAVVICFSALSVLAVWVFVKVMGYAPETAAIILLLSAGLLPYSLSAVCEAVFQAWERMHYIAYANVPWNVLKIVLAFVVLMSGAGVRELAFIILASLVAITLLEWWIVARQIAWPRFRFDPSFASDLIRSAYVFLGIEVVIAVWSALPILILSKIGGEREVGVFSSAAQLMVPVLLVHQSIVLSVFPIMCRRFGTDPSELREVAENVIEVLMAVALPTAVGLFFVADSALLLIYGEADFLEAGLALRLLVGLVVFDALTSTLGRVLYAAGHERTTFRIVLVNALVTLGLGLLLIGRFGVAGGAAAVVITGALNTAQHYAAARRILEGLRALRTLWMAVLASAAMAIYLHAVGPRDLWFTVSTGAATYVVAFVTLALWSHGGWAGLKRKYAAVWSAP